MKKILFNIAFISALFLASCSDDNESTVSETSIAGNLAFTASTTFGSSAFTLDNEYTTPEGDKIKPSEIRYWVSNVVLTKADGSTYAVPNAYYLIQQCKAQEVQEGSFTMPATKRETVNIANIPAGTYTGVTFSIGVDSEHNDNLSLQSGELSILQNMTNISWMWHTSYIFSKIGGTYTNGNGETFSFLFETGTNDVYKTITKTFSQPIRIDGLKPATITMNVDAAKLFTGIKITDAKRSGNVYTIGAATPELMAKLATNYTNAFTLERVENVAP